MAPIQVHPIIKYKDGEQHERVQLFGSIYRGDILVSTCPFLAKNKKEEKKNSPRGSNRNEKKRSQHNPSIPANTTTAPSQRRLTLEERLSGGCGP
jgi:hypothetical protein